MVLSLSHLLARAGELRRDDWLSASVAAVAVAALVFYGRRPKRSEELPRPESTLPVLGNTLDTMKKQRARLYDWLADESLRHGGKPWQLRVVGRPRSIVTTAPEIFEDALSTQLDVFKKGEQSCSLIRDFFGQGILAVDDEQWHFQRKTASHLFSLQMMRDVMTEVIREKTALLHDVLLAHATDAKTRDQPLSIRRVITHFTSDVFAKIGFGVELDCLQRSLAGDDENDFVAAFSYCARMLQLRLQQPSWLWRLKRFLNIGDEKVYKQQMRVIDELIYDIIAKSVAAKSKDSSRPAKDLITFFLESEGDKSLAQNWRKGMNESELQHIRDMVVTFIFAGKDTTANALSWFVVMMNRHPHVVKRIREELRAKLPALMAGGALYVPTMEDLKHLTYLEAAIRENLRLNPPVAITARTAESSTVLSDGTAVNKGDRVVLATYAQARQPSVWGKDAAEFKPERWLDEATGQLLTVSPFQFSAFLAGPRICLGRKLAMLEMKLALAVLVARFDIATVDDPWRVTYELALTFPVAGPLMATVQARQ